MSKPTTKIKPIPMMDVSEVKSQKGTSFIIYGASGSRKTRSLGTIPNDNFTLHCSLDSGSTSAAKAAEDIGITESEHKVTTPTSLADLNDIILSLHMHKPYKDTIDNIVFDNLVTITSWIQTFVAASKKYEKDALHVADAYADDTDKNAQGSKSLAYYNDVQRLTRELVFQILQLTDSYNVFLLAGEVPSEDSDGSPMVKVQINGPKSINPVVSMFSEVYRTSFNDNDFDSADGIKTKFKIAKYTDPLTGTRYFGKTRNITNVDYLTANEMPADFRLIFDEIGYVCKKDRVKK